MTEERYYRNIVCGDEGLYDKNGGCIIADIRSNLNLDENWDTIICLLNEQQATITKLEQICEKKMQEIENIKYSLKEIAYKYHKEVQFKTDTDPNQAVKEVLCEQQATIEQLEKVNGENFAKRRLLEQHNLVLRNENRELRQQLQEKQEDEKLYAQVIVKLNKEAKEVLNFRNLGSDY